MLGCQTQAAVERKFEIIGEAINQLHKTHPELAERIPRLRCKASQAVFAAYLNASPPTVQKWEQGKKQPNGSSFKWLNLVDQKGLDALG